MKQTMPAKVRFLFLLATAIVLPTTNAANLVEMQVVSVITPTACTPVLSGSGVADYGTMSVKILGAGVITSLAPVSLTFSITCDARAKVSIRAIDNRTDSIVAGIVSAGSGDSTLDDSFNFGLGTAAGKSIGGYVIKLQPSSYTGDYQAAQLLYSTDRGATWQQSTTGQVAKTRTFGWGISGKNDISAFRNISGTITVYPYINKPEKLSLSQDIPLDGSATLELSYL